MFKYAMLISFILVTLFIRHTSHAMSKDACGSEQPQNCTSCHTLTDKEAVELLKPVGGTLKSIKQAPAKGMFEILMEKNGQLGIVYMDYGKKHLMQGTLFNIANLQPVASHSKELEPKEPTPVDIKKIPVEHAFVIGNPKGTKKLYVFTDPDCPYCRKGHSELKKLAAIAPDVAIHIMLMPLPMHPQAFDKCRIVLETKSLDLLDKAFEGKELPAPKSDESKARIDAILKFAEANGINGTPTMIMPDGKIVVGMRDAETMKKMLEASLDK